MNAKQPTPPPKGNPTGKRPVSPCPPKSAKSVDQCLLAPMAPGAKIIRLSQLVEQLSELRDTCPGDPVLMIRSGFVHFVAQEVGIQRVESGETKFWGLVIS